MARIKIKNSSLRNILMSLLPALICFTAVMVMFAVMGFYPFGKRSVAWCDLEQQYVPLLLEFKGIVENGGSFLLGKGGGGMNLFGAFLFFVSSPLSLLSLIPDKTEMIYFINIITAIRLSLCAFSASVYFKQIFRTLPYSFNILLSLMYSLSGYAMMYYQNNMWLDIMFLFPFLLLSLYRLAYKGKWGMYTVCLSASMLMNYYLSFMNVIFIILAFGIIVYTHNKKNNSLKIYVKFFVGSILAAIITAVVWIPSLLQFTSSGRGNSSVDSFACGTVISHFLDKISLISCTPAIIVGIIFLTVNYKKINSSVAKSIIIMFFVILTAVIIDPINKFWHTGSYQAFPFRYGYIAVLLGLSACAVILAHSQNSIVISKGYIYKLAVFISVGIYCVGIAIVKVTILKNINSYVGSLWVDKKDTIFNIAIGFIAAVIFFLIFWLYHNNIINLKSTVISIAVMLAATTFVNLEVYVGNTEDITLRYNQTMEIADKIDDESFYRVKSQKRYFYSNMLEAMGFDSIAHYTSLTDGDFIYTAKKLGYSSYWMDISTNGGTLVTDAFLMNKYLIGAVSDMNSNYESYNKNDIYKIYKNNIVADGAIICDTPPEELEEFNSAERIEASEIIADKLLNTPEIVTNYSPYSYTNLKYDSNDEGYSFEKINEDDPAYINYSFFADGENEVYFDVFGNYSTELTENYFEAVDIYCNGKLIEERYPNKRANGIIDLGTFTNRYVSIEIVVNSDFESTSFGVFSINPYTFSSALDKAHTAEIELNKNKIELTAEYSGWVYIPFVYNSGYSAAINGEKCEISKVFGSFMAVKVESGDRLILTFYPTGLRLGVLISVFGIVLFIFIMLLLKKRQVSVGSELAAKRVYAVIWSLTFIVFFVFSIFLWIFYQWR